MSVRLFFGRFELFIFSSVFRWEHSGWGYTESYRYRGQLVHGSGSHCAGCTRTLCSPSQGLRHYTNKTTRTMLIFNYVHCLIFRKIGFIWFYMEYCKNVLGTPNLVVL